jgi:hypothetical protein
MDGLWNEAKGEERPTAPIATKADGRR